MENLLAVSTVICVTACTITVTLTGITMYQLIKAPLPQKPVLVVLGIMQVALISIICLTWFIYIGVAQQATADIPNFIKDNKFKIGALGNLTYSCWFLAIWLICFKYWQTAYEMNYLFCLVQRSDQLKVLYLIMHTVVIGSVIFACYVAPSIFYIYDSKGVMVVAMTVLFIVILFVVSLFGDSIRRMQNVFSQIPILKKSERMFFTIIAFYVVFLANFTTSMSIIAYMLKHSRLTADKRVKIGLISQTITILLFCGMQLAFSWIATKYNQPLMTRQDLRTGEKVSLLIFIRSQYDMRKIFDPDSDPQPLLTEDNEVNQSQEMTDPESFSLQSYLEQNEADYLLRQQILFQMFEIDEHRVSLLAN